MTTGQKPHEQRPPDSKPPRIIEELIANYAVDVNLFRLGSTNSIKKSSPWFFLGGAFIRGAYCPGAFDLEQKKYIRPNLYP